MRAVPRRARFHVVIAILNLLAALVAGTTTYSVGPSVSDDFSSIQPALDVAVAGGTIVVREKPTPYFEKIAFPASGNGGSGYITIEAAAGESPVIDGTGVSALRERRWNPVNLLLGRRLPHSRKT